MSDDKLQALWNRFQAARANQVRQSTDNVPAKKSTKRHRKMQNTFDRSMAGAPGGHWFKQAHAATTGCRTRAEGIGVLRSARNANTTQGSYITTTVNGEATDPQGRKAFGR